MQSKTELNSKSYHISSDLKQQEIIIHPKQSTIYNYLLFKQLTIYDFLKDNNMNKLTNEELRILNLLEIKFKNKSLTKKDLDEITSKLILQEFITKLLGNPSLFSSKETIRVNILIQMNQQ
ncbi:hypothetical protein CP965_01960 [Halarcobacter mediterraneus]|uniref:Uncharacterized protein n=1 Tax=Halarcobacter mediterraneus TaxID=2023153 RepID=A0A4V1M1K9_9BACT|nr:hypothetical protein [Halarcobacter mediterraneus]RXK14236.1 hypothetical protein CP965_01960 [Halarcobacter mediterraneus]